MISQSFSLLSFVRTFCISVGNNRTIKCIPAHNISSSLLVDNALLHVKTKVDNGDHNLLLNCHDCVRKPIHRCLTFANMPEIKEMVDDWFSKLSTLLARFLSHLLSN